MSPSDEVILIVEDELLIAMDIETVLNDAGYVTTVSFANCADAQAWLKQTRPAAAILDINLREGSSGPVAQQLIDQSVPFIVSSGERFSSQHEAVFQAGTWIGKPIDRDELLASLANCLRKSLWSV